jgi:hypothetical protein
MPNPLLFLLEAAPDDGMEWMFNLTPELIAFNLGRIWME